MEEVCSHCRRSEALYTYHEQIRNVVLQAKLATLMLSALHVEVSPLNAGNIVDKSLTLNQT